jgi:hypothetical protein
MTDTSEVIASLSQQVTQVKPLPSPLLMIMRLMALFVLYGAACQCLLGVRSDLSVQFTRPLFAAEIMVLILLVLTCLIAGVYSLYPDLYQKSYFLKLPYIIGGVFAALTLYQAIALYDVRMVMPAAEIHGMECALCIAALSFIPAAVMFIVIRKGATVKQGHAGVYSVFIATGMSCLAIRLEEMQDSVAHLLLWHYFPIFLYAIAGAYIGKWLLRW